MRVLYLLGFCVALVQGLAMKKTHTDSSGGHEIKATAVRQEESQTQTQTILHRIQQLERAMQRGDDLLFGYAYETVGMIFMVGMLLCCIAATCYSYQYEKWCCAKGEDAPTQGDGSSSEQPTQVTVNKD